MDTNCTPKGFEDGSAGYTAPTGAKKEINVASDSQRLQLLQPFLNGMVAIW